MVSQSEILNANILIVDDNEDNARSLHELLTAAGYRNVVYTTDGTEVRELHASRHYNLILLDLQMPVMNGFEVMESLRSVEDGYLPVLAVTGEPAYKLQALKAGAKDFISKPYDAEEVLSRVHNMLEVRLLHDEARQTASKLGEMALHDALTGLPNRRLLNERVSAAIANARRKRGTMAVVFMDLDGFKGVNDTLGHDIGDEMLKAVAARLRAVTREEDTVARLGGDEFVIALWNAGTDEDVAKVAAKLIHSISRPYELAGHRVTVTTSAGVGVYPAHGADVRTLMRSADHALYQAKRDGKNIYKIAERALQSSAAYR